MRLINVFEAKTRLSQLLDEVSKGQEIVLGKHGNPIALLIPFPKARKKRKLGSVKGKYWIAPDFDAPLSDDFFLGADK